ncbi:MAG: restriction endonuclease subunit S, partial [Muribaculaceae bacterium]|nr:restriction endonuclease subunit S [Muribaculaceae bacterium]
EVQEQIVAELDTINEGIAALREQVADLDRLAQTLFYETFGDPITNPKGWPVKELGDIAKLINGRAYKQDELLNTGKYKVIRVGNFFTNNDIYYSDLELNEDKYLNNGDLLFAWSASFGAFIWEAERVIYHYHIWKVEYKQEIINKIYFKWLLNEMTSSFRKDLHGIGMMHLTKKGMEQYLLPIPPLSLQQQFAEQIEAIEAMKATLATQIADAQTLLDSRMDYWFN